MSKAKLHIKRGDTVAVISGKEKGKKGKDKQAAADLVDTVKNKFFDSKKLKEFVAE